MSGQTHPKLKFRAQVHTQTTDRWVDGGLYVERTHAEAAAVYMLDRFADYCDAWRVAEDES